VVKLIRPHREIVVLHKYIVRAAAWLEIGTGLGLILLPQFLCLLLFGAPLEGAGVPITRFAGLGLGIACLSMPAATHTRGAVLGLLVYNVGAPILFVWLGLATTFHGILLWPAALLHAGIAAALLPLVLDKASAR
jgi:hypothetical protein